MISHAAIKLDAVNLALGGRTVLANASFAIGANEFVAVLGRNGVGKTTLMRAILGLIPTAAGHIHVLGKPARRGNPAIGAMPQLRASIPVRLRGRDFVAAAAGGHRWGLAAPSVSDLRDVDRALALVDAGALAARPVAELSGGERQRLLLAQALLGKPRLLLLDEPLAGLDPRRQAELVSLVRALQQHLDIAVLFSTHDLNPLLADLDRVLVLSDGQATFGTASEIVTAPALSRLYGMPMQVVRAGGRSFVVSASEPPNPDLPSLMRPNTTAPFPVQPIPNPLNRALAQHRVETCQTTDALGPS